MTGTESANPRPRRQEQEDANEEITEPSPGVVRVQLPVNLPGLGHVNCYVLEDERGIAVIDPGLPGEGPWHALVAGLQRAGYRVGDVHTAVITHSHHDHFGAASRLREETGCEVLTHELFRPPWVTADSEGESADDTVEMLDDDEIERRIDQVFSQRLPWGSQRRRPSVAELAQFKEMGRFGGTWSAVPRPTVRVVDNQPVSLGRREWVAIHTPGHTEDHLCLWDPDGGVMFSGDHVLPSITPHIGGMTGQPDPLAAFFGSLERMTTFAGVSAVLPAHGHPFTDLAGRARDIIEHHEHRLDVVKETAARLGDGTVTDYMQCLFSERAWGDMAESETYAHLEHLRLLGAIQRDDPEGVAHYLLNHDVLNHDVQNHDVATPS
jgi:glyoxylase-like metal-dependent hydrolase (beta-lactamase superfamily II)